MEAAEILWSRSLDKHNFRYTTLLSDGDVKTFKHLFSLKVYGDVRLKKEECINYVKERRRVLPSMAVDMTKLTGYYVWQCDMCTSSQQECDAASCLRHILHATSTDENPDHDRCPKGKESWCFYQKALAAVEVLGSHRANVGTPLSEVVGALVKDVYVRLWPHRPAGTLLDGKDTEHE